MGVPRVPLCRSEQRSCAVARAWPPGLVAVPAVLLQPPRLVATPEGSELSPGSARVTAEQRCLCQPVWPVPCPRCQRPRRAGARPADGSGARRGWKPVQLYPGRRKLQETRENSRFTIPKSRAVVCLAELVLTLGALEGGGMGFFLSVKIKP